MAATISFPMPIQGGVTLTTSATAVATAPPLTQYVIRTAVFSNSTTSPVTIGVNVRGFPIINSQPVPADSTYVSPELAGMVLNPGDAITALCSAGSSVNCFISGYSVV